MKDLYGKWLEAHVIEFLDMGSKFRVHFKGWASKWDEIIPLNDESLIGTKYAEIGLHSKGYGGIKFHSKMRMHKSMLHQQELIKPSSDQISTSTFSKNQPSGDNLYTDEELEKMR